MRTRSSAAVGKTSKRSAFLACVFAVLFSPFAHPADWDSCAYDLDRLRRAARDATDVANDVKAKADELEQCRQYPEIYDLLRDRCRSKVSDYQSARSDLESELSTVASRIRSVSSSCGVDLSPARSSSFAKPEATGDRTCDLYRSYKNKLPFESLLKACTKSMSEAECRKCLSQ